MNTPPDPYRLLGVDHDATPAVIRAAWRRAVRRHHPDAEGNGDREAFLTVQDAYRRICDTHRPPSTNVAALPRPNSTPPPEQVDDPLDAADRLLFDNTPLSVQRQHRTGSARSVAAQTPTASPHLSQTASVPVERPTASGPAVLVGVPLVLAAATRWMLLSLIGDRVPLFAIPSVAVVVAATALGASLAARHHPLLAGVVTILVAAVEAVPLVVPAVAVFVAAATGAHGVGLTQRRELTR